MHIGLLFGGNSYEHDVSIVSTKIIHKLFKKEDKIFLLYVDYDNQMYLIKKIDEEDIKCHSKKVSWVKGGFKKGFKITKLDVLISLMHGANGEDGTAYTLANFYNIPYVGSNHIASGILMNKYYTYAILKENDYPVVESVLIDKNCLDKEFSYPLIIKPLTLGSSIGIEVIPNKEALVSNDIFRYDEQVLGQRFLTDFRELNQAAYLKNGEVILSKIEEVYKKSEILSFTDKYLNSKLPNKHIFLKDKKLEDQICNITKEIYKLFKLSGPVRFDYLLDNEKLYLNEINTTPGSLAYYLFDVEGKTFMYDLIYEALKENQNRKFLRFDSEILERSLWIKKG